MSDLLVKLYDFDLDAQSEALRAKLKQEQGVIIKKASIIDKTKILSFIAECFKNEKGWLNECEYALFNSPVSCYIAVKEKKIIGFACYDATAKGFFGPTGVKEELRGLEIGTALLLKSLQSMKEAGYGYAIIGWAEDAREFYAKTVGAAEIINSSPDKSVYKNMIKFK